MSLTTEQIVGIVTVVVGFTELIKLSKYIPDRFGLLIAAVVAALGEFLFVYSQPEFLIVRTAIWGLVSAYLVIITSAAGVYGVIRESRGGDVTDASKQGFDGKKLVLVFALLGAGFWMQACVKAPPNSSPERKVALYGIQAGKYLAEIKTSADNLYTEKLLPEPAYRQVLKGLIIANTAGEQLGAALKAYDAAINDTERNSVVAQIDAALLALQAALPTVVPNGLPLEVAQRLAKGVAEVQQLLITIARFTAPSTTVLDPGQNPECILRHCRLVAA